MRIARDVYIERRVMLIQKKKFEKLEERIHELEDIVAKHTQYIQNEILNPKCNLTQMKKEVFEKIVRDQLIPVFENVVSQEQRKGIVP